MAKPLTQQQKEQWDRLLNRMTSKAGLSRRSWNTVLIDWGPDCSGAQYLLATTRSLFGLWETCDMIGDPWGASFKVIKHPPFLSLNLSVTVDDEFEIDDDEPPPLNLTGTITPPEGDADGGFHDAVAEAIHNRDGWKTFEPEFHDLAWARIGGSEYPDNPVPKETLESMGI